MSGRSNIGTLSEWSLHSELKKNYLTIDSQEEVEVDGYIIDVVREDLLIEIQTSGFSSIHDKLRELIKSHQVRLVHPIPVEKWIVRESLDGSSVLSRRRSPKRMGPQNVFDELVYIPTLIHHQNLSIEVLLTQEEEVRRKDNKGSWRRRGWSIVDRRLLAIVGRKLYKSPSDLLHFIPDSLESEFTNKDLAEATGYSKREAGKITYCLRRMGIIRVTGKRGRANVFQIRST
ncbi:hypothetical protein EU545_02800 [Candidatus Thorarchaeota archaeon]|jgi:hypothetical protein|nr:MAG: hypothetical protein EU545_02800 [Candidatus Thorarchaeota archaeon]